MIYNKHAASKAVEWGASRLHLPLIECTHAYFYMEKYKLFERNWGSSPSRLFIWKPPKKETATVGGFPRDWSKRAGRRK